MVPRKSPFGGGRELRGSVGSELAEGKARGEEAARAAAFSLAVQYRNTVAGVREEVLRLLRDQDPKVGEHLDLRLRAALGRAEQELLGRLVAAQARVIEAGLRAVGAEGLLDASPSVDEAPSETAAAIAYNVDRLMGSALQRTNGPAAPVVPVQTAADGLEPGSGGVGRPTPSPELTPGEVEEIDRVFGEETPPASAWRY